MAPDSLPAGHQGELQVLHEMSPRVTTALCMITEWRARSPSGSARCVPVSVVTCRPMSRMWVRGARVEMWCTTFLPFASFDSNEHSLAVDIGDFQADSLRDAQPGSVTDRQDGAMLDALYTAQELLDLLRTQDNRQLLRLLRFFGVGIISSRLQSLSLESTAVMSMQKTSSREPKDGSR
jgi:hypothetical protein